MKGGAKRNLCAFLSDPALGANHPQLSVVCDPLPSDPSGRLVNETFRHPLQEHHFHGSLTSRTLCRLRPYHSLPTLEGESPRQV